ncbi:hypothetical protein [Lysinibacillus sp. OF-1]|uniref:hypothetical protein n=1 Tax=Lysinibacillus sp. OF-1 TaxID=2972483 RepID=UPI0023304E2B|nr:hypothetical protein [Lysinibacillus sp. OF-1]WCH46413.1 hypothetical protein NV349_15100 [Lysinibacillus sp. OF-1]
MLGQLQNAYRQALRNLVFVDFVNKKVIGGFDVLELELAKENACCKDLITAINHHFRRGDFDLAKERIDALRKRADYINRLENQVKAYRRNKLFEIASQLEKRGKESKVVKYDASPS